MIESEGITENVEHWRTDVIGRIIEALGIDKVMFEAADPAVFEWYVKTGGSRRAAASTPAARSAGAARHSAGGRSSRHPRHSRH